MVPLVMSLASLTSRTSMSIIVVGGVASSLSTIHCPGGDGRDEAILCCVGFCSVQHEARNGFLTAGPDVYTGYEESVCSEKIAVITLSIVGHVLYSVSLCWMI